MESRSCQNTPLHKNGDERSGLRKRRNSAPELELKSTKSSRPSYVVPTKDKIRHRSRRVSTTNGAGGSHSRAMSPINYKVREYLSRADEKIEDYLERIVQNVHVKAENAQVMVQSLAQKLRNWKACHFEKLPSWMRDNDFLHFGHRPELPSFAECFRSIFRIHTETGNIWTHLIGFVAFVIATIVFYVKPFCDICSLDIEVNDKLIFLCFFIGALLCLACSTLFHTVACHSQYVSKIFSKLDYAGIALLIVGSTIPWLYYGFYCQFYTKLTYIIAVSVLGLLTMILLTWEKFDEPEYRVLRTSVFVTLALVSALPIIHFIIQNGMAHSIAKGGLIHLLSMGGLYLLGAFLYAARIPERWLPGKCDIWFQSHQIFHLLVVTAAFVHYQGISEMAMHRVKLGSMCPTMAAVTS